MQETKPGRIPTTEDLAKTLVSDLDRLHQLKLRRYLALTEWAEKRNSETENGYVQANLAVEDLESLIKIAPLEVRVDAQNLLDEREKRSKDVYMLQLKQINESRELLKSIEN